MLEPAPEGQPGWSQARRALIEVLEYRAVADLARAWRVIQPDLDQCGLVSIEYEGLSELARIRDVKEVPSWRRRSPHAGVGIARDVELSAPQL